MVVEHRFLATKLSLTLDNEKKRAFSVIPLIAIRNFLVFAIQVAYSLARGMRILRDTIEQNKEKRIVTRMLVEQACLGSLQHSRHIIAARLATLYNKLVVQTFGSES